MSLKSILEKFSGGDPATVERLEKRVATAQADLAEAEAAYRVACLNDSRRGGSALPADRAEKAVAEARRRLERAEAALVEAQERRKGLEQAQAQAAQRKRVRACKASLKRLREAGETVDVKIDELVAALHAALDEQATLRNFTNDRDTRAAMARANAALHFCVEKRLLFMSGRVDTTATPERTRFSNYLPSPEPPDRDGDAMTARAEAAA